MTTDLYVFGEYLQTLFQQNNVNVSFIVQRQGGHFFFVPPPPLKRFDGLS